MIPHSSVEAAEAARTFRNLGEFLDGGKQVTDKLQFCCVLLLYKTLLCTEINAANAILKTEEDFYDVTHSYLVRVASENVRYAELQVGVPQMKTSVCFLDQTVLYI